MKKSILYLASLALLALATACSDSYLNTYPENKQSNSTIFATTKSAAYAVNGICKLFTTQYISQGWNGEGNIISHYGEVAGIDLQKSNYTTWDYIHNGTRYGSNSYYIVSFAWDYYYTIISNANQIINNIDNAEGSQAERDFIKAQGLTFRAYAYSALVKIYSQRWKDSNNGSTRGVILRTECDNAPMAASSLGECYEQIYKDLNEAIALYEKSGLDRPAGDKYSPNEAVAHAVFSRAALNRDDWQTAYDQAKLARKGYTTMTPEEWASGFNTPNQEWIWYAFHDATQTIHHYGFFSYFGSNTDTSAGRQNVPSINKELIDQIPASDVRRDLFLVPLESEMNDFSKDDSGKSKGSKYGMEKRARKNFKNYLCAEKTTTIYAYMSFKFRASGGHSDGHLCLFRAGEMIYNQAEAAYMLGGKEDEIRNLLIEANKPYDTNFTCTESGEALFEKVKLYRRWDLWGEGHNWYDLKRRKESHIRHSWAEGGNSHPTFCGTGETGGCYGPNDRYNWTYCYPKHETEYNPLVTTFEGNWSKE